MSPEPEPGLTDVRRHSTLVAGGILASRLAGFVRQRAIAHYFGTGSVVDAFNAALKIPNLLQNLLGEGVLSASFIPVYSRLLAEDRTDDARRVAGAIAGLLALVAGTLVLIGVVFARPITLVIAPGFTQEKLELTVGLLRILFPGIGFLVLSAWCLGVLNSHRRFFLSYVAPVLWNAAQIGVLVGFGVAGLAREPLVVALAWGAFVGGALQFAVQLPAVLAVAGGVRPTISLRPDGVRRVLSAFAPVVAGRGVVQLLGYIDLTLASLLAAGAIAALSYAQQLFLLPISLFGMSVAAAELPALSGAHVERGRTDTALISLRQRLDSSLARIAFYVVPSALVFVLLGDEVVALLYRTGAFDEPQVDLVWAVLAALSVGLVANTSARLLQSSLYAAGDARTPAKVAALRVVLGAVLGGVFMLQFDRVGLGANGLVLLGDLPAFTPVAASLRQQTDVLRLGAVGIALASGMSAWLEYHLLRRALHRTFGLWLRAGGQERAPILIAAAAAALTALGARALVAGWRPWVATPVALALTGGVYLAVAHRAGVGEARNLVAMLDRARR